jgi:hypothetical protein
MSFERGFSKPRIPAERESGDRDVESEDADGVDELALDKDVSEQSDISVEDTQTSTRQEVRAFTKEHSQFYRDQLAQRIRGRRSWVRRKRGELLDEASSVDEGIEMWRSEGEQIQSELESLEGQKKDIEALQVDVEELESEIEAIKASFWKPIFKRDELNALASRLTLAKHKQMISEFDYGRITEKLELAGKELQRNNELIEAGNKQVSELVSTAFYEDDALVTEAKGMISDFYAKNLRIKQQEEEAPAARDATALSKKHNVLLKHGIIDKNESGEEQFLYNSTNNNGVVSTVELSPSQKINLVAALEPTLSTHTEGPFRKGLIVGQGEVTAAYNFDAGTYAVDFDERVAKYDESRVSSLMPNIEERFDSSVKNPGDGFREWNEIIVKRPKFSALYIKSDGEFGKKDSFGRNKFFKSAKWALEESIRLGIPAVVELDTGEYINLATDEVVTKEELLSYTGTYSPEERAKLFTEAQINQGESFKKQVDTEGRIQAVSERGGGDAEEVDDLKQFIKEMAQARLDLLLAEEEVVAQQLIKEYGTTNVSSYLDN